MVDRCVMFGEIIGLVLKAGTPVYVEVSLVYAVLDPVKSHVNGSGSLLGDGVVGKFGGCGIVGLDGCGGLWVAHFVEHCSDDFGTVAIQVEGTNFGFKCRGHDILDDGCEDAQGALLWFWFWVWFATKKEVSTSAAASLGLREVGGVAVYLEDHVAGTILDAGIVMGCGVIKELVDDFLGGFSGFALLGTESAKCSKHGAVDCSGIIQEYTNDLLYAGDALGW